MNNRYSNTDKDIHERIFKYVVIGLKVIKEITRTPENIPIIGQLSGSLTSMGANDQEADSASSKKDFAQKYGIVRKETKETIYWWRVLRETGFKHEQLDWLVNEGKEIHSVVTTIILNSKD